MDETRVLWLLSTWQRPKTYGEELPPEDQREHY